MDYEFEYRVTFISLNTNYQQIGDVAVLTNKVNMVMCGASAWRLFTVLRQCLQLSACMRQKPRNLHIGS